MEKKERDAYEDSQGDTHMIRYYCDFCGKETFHMDLGHADNRHICPECMKVRCQNMAKTILDTDLGRMRSEDVKYLHNNLYALLQKVDLLRELRKLEKTD